jgi:hypothetical protein
MCPWENSPGPVYGGAGGRGGRTRRWTHQRRRRARPSTPRHGRPLSSSRRGRPPSPRRPRRSASSVACSSADASAVWASAHASSASSVTKSSGPMTRPFSASLEEEEGDDVVRSVRSERRRQGHATVGVLVRLGADDARPPLSGGLRHQSVDAVLVAAPSADAAATHTCATAPEIHRRK